MFQFPPDKAQTSPDCSGAAFGKKMEPVHFRIMFKVRDPPATSGGEKNEVLKEMVGMFNSSHPTRTTQLSQLSDLVLDLDSDLWSPMFLAQDP